MSKPTAKLYTEILSFVSSHPKVQHVAGQRDNSDKAYLKYMTCRYNAHNPNDQNISSYHVDYVYETKDISLEQNDDFRVHVLVTHNPFQLKLHSVTFG